MKKKFSSRAVPVLCFVALLVLGCGGDDDKVTTASCDKAVSSYEAALNAYIADIENVSKCEALKSTLSDLVDCPGLNAGQRKEYQDEVDAIDCD